ncbi:helix-turn-helix domain containing protein [Rhizobium sp. CB3171]|uniref:TetR/AcrR family transcriptional regulator n=1 Tax=unclassified Rhizobium TaxID=2613769 RepID=UPI000CDF5473|nr:MULTISPECIES: TetR/AcrR family transcriptional regulator [Rhizobium]AVA20366.1 TetR family transcriptional regulator protein [Rhizobium sp. NXC24]MDK4742130.1 helix-turn-helix domain containing protein [Rhizobium sp. CNPSo 3464]UWU21656.1 TetR/AcrR family transcriptional regulator [Rhizobium tropici]WFU02474.1 helix-turn-helix domain containing protein [Rhizobium sp. CB3171]
MHDRPLKPEGLREQKRRLTFQRIAEVGLKSFLAKGYQETTIDEIAAAAGISRRTFFYYFKSKDDILLAHQRGYMDALRASITENASAGRPLDVIHQATLRLVARLQAEAPQLLETARLLRQSESLRARTRSNYLQLEQVAYETLCELFPTRDRDGLRLVSMIAVSPLRLSVDKWLQEDGKLPLIDYMEDALKKWQAEI